MFTQGLLSYEDSIVVSPVDAERVSIPRSPKTPAHLDYDDYCCLLVATLSDRCSWGVRTRTVRLNRCSLADSEETHTFFSRSEVESCYQHCFLFRPFFSFYSIIQKRLSRSSVPVLQKAPKIELYTVSGWYFCLLTSAAAVNDSVAYWLLDLFLFH